MKNTLYFMAFALGAASILGIEFIFDKTFRRRAVELEEKAENLINAEVAKASETFQGLKGKEIGWHVRDEINDAFDNLAQVIGKGAEMVEGVLENAKI
jgi:hypothetical protein